MAIVGWLWKKYPWESQPVIHLILEILLISVWTMLYSMGLYRIEIYFGLMESQDVQFLEVFITLLITYLITAIHEMVYFYQQWKMNFSRSVRLERDNIHAKYEALKTQINPHFLFNSLNSLTSLVDDNEDAVAYIQDLSEFLRYMLTSRDKELVLVREEVSLLKKYISLQESRFKKTLRIELDVPESTWHYALPPLVLQMLVENCIKHNVISKEKPLDVSVQARNNSIIVENTLQKKKEVTSTGQGLRNIAERYKLFTTREVKTEETRRLFRVTIPLLKVEL
jgi:LytS/YehU family sensor histidine kinase